MRVSSLFRRHVALPGEHGAWVFLLRPLLIGLFAGGRWHTVSVYLVIAVLCGFLIRHPITLAVKVHAGRRPRETLPAARFWIAVYAGIGLLHVTGLVVRGFGYLLYLAIPGIPVFFWHLYLISRRADRRQWLVEMIGTGVLALSAPAGLWVGLGHPDPIGWLLWALVWAQSISAIAYTYVRLSQRVLPHAPAWPSRLRMGGASLAVSLGVLAAVVALCVTGALPRWLFLPYALQAAEVVWGVSHPAIGLKPKAIGYRQLGISTLFTVLFIVTWLL